MKNTLFLFAFAITLSCGTNKPANPSEPAEGNQNQQTMDNRLTGKWVLDYMTPVTGKDIHQLFKIQKPYLNFVDESKVAGNNGCNNIAGEYSAEGNVIHFATDKFRSTRMFCEGVDERAFIGVLKTINRYDVINDGQKLILLTSDIVSMTFVKAAE